MTNYYQGKLLSDISKLPFVKNYYQVVTRWNTELKNLHENRLRTLQNLIHLPKMMHFINDDEKIDRMPLKLL